MREEISQLQADIRRHTDEIWVEEPKDVYRFKNGVIESGAGIKDQYFTVMVMLSGEVRSLGVHTFSDLSEFAKSGKFTLEQLTFMTKKMLAVDLGVIGYFGLVEFGKLLSRFNDSLELFGSVEEYSQLVDDLFMLANRYQLWMHQIFPWKLMTFFPKTTERELEEKLQKISS